MQIFKSVAIVSLTAFWIFLTLFLLLFFEHDKSFIDLLFEATSAVTNIGVSIFGVQFLSTSSQLFLLLAMIIGRIGPLTLIASLRLSYETKGRGFSYPEERVMLG